MSLQRRIVKRVLVMLEYEINDQHNGEVFDLTALANELATAQNSQHNHALIELKVQASKDYSATINPTPIKTEVSWNVMADFHSSGDAAYLDDAVNVSMPDSFATEGLKKKRARIQNTLEKLSNDIQVQKLRDAAGIRHLRPVARVVETALALAVGNEVAP